MLKLHSLINVAAIDFNKHGAEEFVTADILATVLLMERKKRLCDLQTALALGVRVLE